MNVMQMDAAQGDPKLNLAGPPVMGSRTAVRGSAEYQRATGGASGAAEVGGGSFAQAQCDNIDLNKGDLSGGCDGEGAGIVDSLASAAGDFGELPQLSGEAAAYELQRELHPSLQQHQPMFNAGFDQSSVVRPVYPGVGKPIRPPMPPSNQHAGYSTGAQRFSAVPGTSAPMSAPHGGPAPTLNQLLTQGVSNKYGSQGSFDSMQLWGTGHGNAYVPALYQHQQLQMQHAKQMMGASMPDPRRMNGMPPPPPSYYGQGSPQNQYMVGTGGPMPTSFAPPMRSPVNRSYGGPLHQGMSPSMAYGSSQMPPSQMMYMQQQQQQLQQQQDRGIDDVNSDMPGVSASGAASSQQFSTAAMMSAPSSSNALPGSGGAGGVMSMSGHYQGAPHADFGSHPMQQLQPHPATLGGSMPPRHMMPPPRGAATFNMVPSSSGHMMRMPASPSSHTPPHLMGSAMHGSNGPSYGQPMTYPPMGSPYLQQYQQQQQQQQQQQHQLQLQQLQQQQLQQQQQHQQLQQQQQQQQQLQQQQLQQQQLQQQQQQLQQHQLPLAGLSGPGFTFPYQQEQQQQQQLSQQPPFGSGLFPGMGTAGARLPPGVLRSGVVGASGHLRSPSVTDAPCEKKPRKDGGVSVSGCSSSSQSHPPTPVAQSPGGGENSLASAGGLDDDVDGATSSPDSPGTPTPKSTVSSVAAAVAAGVGVSGSSNSGGSAMSAFAVSSASGSTSGLLECIGRMSALGDEPERRRFFDRLYELSVETGVPAGNVPHMSKQPLDLYRLYTAVKERGGFEQVSKRKWWKEIGNCIQSGGASSYAAFTLKKAYVRFLLHYECRYDRNGRDPQTIISALEAKAANAKKNSQKKKEAQAAAAASAAGQPGGSSAVPEPSSSASSTQCSAEPPLQSGDFAQPSPMQFAGQQQPAGLLERNGAEAGARMLQQAGASASSSGTSAIHAGLSYVPPGSLHLFNNDQSLPDGGDSLPAAHMQAKENESSQHHHQQEQQHSSAALSPASLHDALSSVGDGGGSSSSVRSSSSGHFGTAACGLIGNASPHASETWGQQRPEDASGDFLFGLRRCSSGGVAAAATTSAGQPRMSPNVDPGVAAALVPHKQQPTFYGSPENSVARAALGDVVPTIADRIGLNGCASRSANGDDWQQGLKKSQPGNPGQYGTAAGHVDGPVFGVSDQTGSPASGDGIAFKSSSQFANQHQRNYTLDGAASPLQSPGAAAVSGSHHQQRLPQPTVQPRPVSTMPGGSSSGFGVSARQGPAASDDPSEGVAGRHSNGWTQHSTAEATAASEAECFTNSDHGMHLPNSTVHQRIWAPYNMQQQQHSMPVLGAAATVATTPRQAGVSGDQTTRVAKYSSASSPGSTATVPSAITNGWDQSLAEQQDSTSSTEGSSRRPIQQSSPLDFAVKTNGLMAGSSLSSSSYRRSSSAAASSATLPMPSPLARDPSATIDASVQPLPSSQWQVPPERPGSAVSNSSSPCPRGLSSRAPPVHQRPALPSLSWPDEMDYGECSRGKVGDIEFPVGSIEATACKPARKRVLYSKDLGSVDPWHIVMSLKSGLLCESTWACNALNILLHDDSTVVYFHLLHLPGLLDVVLEHFLRSLSDLFSEFECRGFDDDLTTESDGDNAVAEFRQHSSRPRGANRTATSRKSAPMSADDAGDTAGGSWSVWRTNRLDHIVDVPHNPTNDGDSAEFSKMLFYGRFRRSTASCLSLPVKTEAVPDGLLPIARAERPVPSSQRDYNDSAESATASTITARPLSPEPFDADEPLLVAVPHDEAGEQRVERCLSASNVLRSLTFVPGNEKHMCSSAALLVALATVLRLGRAPDWRTASCDWRWPCLDALREDGLVVLSNIGGHLGLSTLDEATCRPLLDGLLFWATSRSSYATEAHSLAPVCTAPLGGPPVGGSTPTLQRLAVEALCKVCAHDGTNVDLLLATPPWSRVVRLLAELMRLVAAPADPARGMCSVADVAMRELAIVLLSSLVQGGDGAPARALGLLAASRDEPPCVSLLIDFIETAERAALHVAQSQGVNALRDNPVAMGTSVDMIRRAATVLLAVAQIPENRLLYSRHQSRLIALVTSQILDQHVSRLLSSVLYECGKASLS